MSLRGARGNSLSLHGRMHGPCTPIPTFPRWRGKERASVCHLPPPLAGEGWVLVKRRYDATG